MKKLMLVALALLSCSCRIPSRTFQYGVPVRIPPELISQNEKREVNVFLHELTDDENARKIHLGSRQTPEPGFMYQHHFVNFVNPEIGSGYAIEGYTINLVTFKWWHRFGRFTIVDIRQAFFIDPDQLVEKLAKLEKTSEKEIRRKYKNVLERKKKEQGC